jgi:hypothetical protein
MFRRSLSDVFVERLCAAPFWVNVIGNPLLQPEIRQESVTVYCRGSGLVRDLRLQQGGWVARTHPSFVPVASERDSVELRCDDSAGFTFVNEPKALPPGVLSASTLAAYMQRLPDRPEDLIKDAIVRHTGNVILDQEVAFADSATERDRVDVCAYLPDQNALVLVEIKRKDDARLFSPDGLSLPEVITQLSGYRARLQSQAEEVMPAYREVVRLKRRLGLGSRLGSLPEGGPIDYLHRPILVVGECSDKDIEAIRSGQGKWEPLLRALPEVASCLILCGTTCKLTMGRHRHVVNFD